MLAFLMLFISACGSSSSTGNGGQNAGGTTKEKNDPIKIGVLASTTGALETYGKQTIAGFELGLDYATDGTRTVNGRKIVACSRT